MTVLGIWLDWHCPELHSLQSALAPVAPHSLGADEDSWSIVESGIHQSEDEHSGRTLPSLVKIRSNHRISNNYLVFQVLCRFCYVAAIFKGKWSKDHSIQYQTPIMHEHKVFGRNSIQDASNAQITLTQKNFRKQTKCSLILDCFPPKNPQMFQSIPRFVHIWIVTKWGPEVQAVESVERTTCASVKHELEDSPS